jgi:chaperonin GroES
MRAVKYIIVEVDSNYNNEKKLDNGSTLIINNTIESVEHINRIVKVVSAPKNTILKKGDEIIVHHNILRLRYDTKGKQIESDFFIKDNLYYVPPTQVFMYKEGGIGNWKAINPYCFVKPIKKEREEKIGSLYTPNSFKDNTHKGMIKNTGILTYPNEDLINMGLKEGDKILFSKDSEYEFKIDDEVYYKMTTSDIMGLLTEEI